MYLPVQAAPVNRTVAGMGSLPAGVFPSAVCLGVGVNNQGEVCVNLPVVGNVCIPIHTPFPPGTLAQACVNTCTHWGFPTGACATVTVANHQVAHYCVGWC
jgi:hypothetical protein